MLFRRLIPVLLLAPGLSLAASKEMTELMRDVALLQQQVKDMQAAQDEKFTRLTVLVQQTLDIATKANTSVAVLESGIRNTLQDQLKGVVGTSAGVGAKMDAMSGDVQALRASMDDVTGRLNKLQQQLQDLNKAVQAMQAPAAPPPPAPGTTGVPGTPGSGGPAAANTGCPPASEPLYSGALRDRLGGKLDLALQEFRDYLRCFGNGVFAPNAQFYVGDIHYAQNDLESALNDFDVVLEKYPDNTKTADAMLMKGKTLVKMGQPTKGGEEFREVIRKFPRSDQATQAAAQLKALGIPYRATPSTSKKRSR